MVGDKVLVKKSREYSIQIVGVASFPGPRRGSGNEAKIGDATHAENSTHTHARSSKVLVSFGNKTLLCI